MPTFTVEVELNTETAQELVDDLCSYTFSRRLPALDALYTQLRNQVRAELERLQRSPRIHADNYEVMLTAYRHEGFDDPTLEVELYRFARARGLIYAMTPLERDRYTTLLERGSL